MTRPIRVQVAGHPDVEAFLATHEDVVTLAEARWLRAQSFEEPPGEVTVRELWVHLQLVLDMASPAIDLRLEPPDRRAPGHPLVEDFIDAHAHCVTVAQAARLRRLSFPNDSPVTMELLTGLWALLHYETLVRDKCVQGGTPARELIEHMLQQVVADTAAAVGAVGEA